MWLSVIQLLSEIFQESKYVKWLRTIHEMISPFFTLREATMYIIRYTNQATLMKSELYIVFIAEFNPNCICCLPFLIRCYNDSLFCAYNVQCASDQILYYHFSAHDIENPTQSSSSMCPPLHINITL